MKFAFALVLMISCATAKNIIKEPRFIGEPRATAPTCSRPYAQVTVPAGGSYTFSQSGAPSSQTVCGWVFKSADGSTLNVDCSTFSLGRGEDLVVSEKDGSTEVDRNRYTASGPQNDDLSTDKVAIAYRYKYGQTGRFTCTVSSDSSSSDSSSSSSSSTSTKSCQCGIANQAASRIVGGTETEENEYPWQVGLVYPYPYVPNVFCGATLISDRYILTAAHCMPGQTVDSFDVMLGGHDTTSYSDSTIVVDPIRIITHANYNDNTMNNDIALIEIEPLDFSDPSVKVRPVCLPDSNDQYVGQDATVSGWGTLSSGGDQPDVLQDVTVPIVSNTYCNSKYGNSITNNMICAGTSSGGKDSCQGDSGGPLVIPDGDNYELVGVVSFGVGCGDAQYPGVYARVSQYLTWIENNTSGDSTCSR